MYKHILISTDGSDVAQKGVDHGLSLAKSLEAKVDHRHRDRALSHLCRRRRTRVGSGAGRNGRV
ncbi:universal stress protein [Novosphingobium resinovorum]|uniref:universal stress protein n=1 Tax=Novosphingobium resinovorum TaxID=158500 RepID=UPI003B8A7ECA